MRCFPDRAARLVPAICYAFRQYVSESHHGLDDKWKRVVDIYYAGHWPIGVAAGKLALV